MMMPGMVIDELWFLDFISTSTKVYVLLDSGSQRHPVYMGFKADPEIKEIPSMLAFPEYEATTNQTDSESTEISYVLIPANDKTYTYNGIDNVEIGIPEDAAHGFYAGVNYISGSTPLPIVFTNSTVMPLKIFRYGLSVSSYIPSSNKTITMIFYADGINVYCYITEVE